MDWSDDKIKKITKSLSESNTIQGAIDKLGWETTPSAVRHALRARGLPSPSEYFKNGGEEVHSEQYYEFDWADEVIILSEEQMKRLCTMRSEVDGLGMTCEQIAIKYPMFDHTLRDSFGSPLPAEFYEEVFNIVGQKKNRSSETLAEASEDPLKVAEETRHVREMLKEQFYQTPNRKLDNFLKRQDDFFKEVRDSLKVFDDLEFRDLSKDVPRKDEQDARSGVVLLSDLHGGFRFTTEEIVANYKNIVNEFSREILIDRIGYVCKIIEEHDWAPYDELVYINLGDNFEALLANMREGQFLTMDVYGKQQYQLVLDCLLMVEHTLERVAKKYDIPLRSIYIGGNHDRITKDKAWNSEELVNYILVDRIASQFSGDKEILPVRGPCKINLKCGTCVVASHGHQNMPKSDAQIVMHKDLHGEPNARRYLIVQGHLHHLLFKTGKDWTYVVNPSVVGATEYSVEGLDRCSPPMFAMIECTQYEEKIIGPYNLRRQ